MNTHKKSTFLPEGVDTSQNDSISGKGLSLILDIESNHSILVSSRQKRKSSDNIEGRLA